MHNLTKSLDNHYLFIRTDLHRYEYVLLNRRRIKLIAERYAPILAHVLSSRKTLVKKEKWRTNSIKKLQIIVCEYATFLFSFYFKPTGEENFNLVSDDSVVLCR